MRAVATGRTAASPAQCGPPAIDCQEKHSLANWRQSSKANIQLEKPVGRETQIEVKHECYQRLGSDGAATR
jgi:hypothetical protein